MAGGGHFVAHIPAMPTTPETDNLSDVPSVDEYIAAIRECRPVLRLKNGRSIVLELLRAHHAAPRRTMTAGQLARGAGLPDFQTVNLLYGAYAKELARTLGVAPRYSIAVLVRFGERTADDLVQWTMLPQVAEALDRMQWVGRPRR